MIKKGQLMKKYLIEIILVISLTACCGQPIVTSCPPLPLPVKTDIPKITDSELSCLSDDIYKKIAISIEALKQDREILRAEILSTHNGVE